MATYFRGFPNAADPPETWAECAWLVDAEGESPGVMGLVETGMMVLVETGVVVLVDITLKMSRAPS